MTDFQASSSSSISCISNVKFFLLSLSDVSNFTRQSNHRWEHTALRTPEEAAEETCWFVFIMLPVPVGKYVAKALTHCSPMHLWLVLSIAKIPLYIYNKFVTFGLCQPWSH